MYSAPYDNKNFLPGYVALFKLLRIYVVFDGLDTGFILILKLRQGLIKLKTRIFSVPAANKYSAL